MKKLVASVIVAFLALNTVPAQADTKVKVLNSSKISTKTGLVSITVSGLPTEHGIYISQCMGIYKGKTEPSACNPAKDTKPVGTLKCDTKTKKWIGSKSLSPITTPSTPASTETKTGTN